MSHDIVAVTGASGLIAKHCIAELLKAGFAVRGTLRSLEKAEAVRKAVTRAGADAGGLSFAVADLTGEEGWDEAIGGAGYVLHVASPFPMQQPKARDDVVLPARDGTLRVLAAAARAKVKRVVVTSSIAAVIYPSLGEQSRTYTEIDWTDPVRADLTPYIVSKTLAEKAAWAFVQSTPGGPQLAVINPGFVQGPALDDDLSTSHEVIRQMAQGKIPVTPKAGYPMVDVRDVAALHVKAMLHPAAAGQRFLATNGYLTLREIAEMVVRTLPDLAAKVPRHEVPDLLVRLASFAKTSARAVLPHLGVKRRCDSRKAKELFEYTFHSPSEAVVGAVQSLRALQLI
jgi:nucleoside-diphosphate-sugar epimerase